MLHHGLSDIKQRNSIMSGNLCHSASRTVTALIAKQQDNDKTPLLQQPVHQTFKRLHQPGIPRVIDAVIEKHHIRLFLNERSNRKHGVARQRTRCTRIDKLWLTTGRKCLLPFFLQYRDILFSPGNHLSFCHRCSEKSYPSVLSDIRIHSCPPFPSLRWSHDKQISCPDGSAYSLPFTSAHKSVPDGL